MTRPAFNVIAALAGAPIETRTGQPARILDFDPYNFERPVTAEIRTRHGHRITIQLREDGRLIDTFTDTDRDLFMKPTRPPTHPAPAPLLPP